MAVCMKPDTPSLSHPESDTSWQELYPSLWSFASYLVRSFSLPCWQGQEEDIIADIVQETARRMLERTKKAERGEAEPVHSPRVMMMVIASNYYRDMKRRDRRLVRKYPSAGSATLETMISPDYQESYMDVATEKVYQEKLFTLLAHEISTFPAKQREALLIDLATRMSFGGIPTPLQKAFLQAGIQLEQYYHKLPGTAQERTRYASLLTHAYKRIASLPSILHYATV